MSDFRFQIVSVTKMEWGCSNSRQSDRDEEVDEEDTTRNGNAQPRAARVSHARSGPALVDLDLPNDNSWDSPTPPYSPQPVNGTFEADLEEAIRRSLAEDEVEEVGAGQPLVEENREELVAGGGEEQEDSGSDPRPGCSHWPNSGSGSSGAQAVVSSTSSPGVNWEVKYWELLQKHLGLISDLQVHIRRVGDSRTTTSHTFVSISVNRDVPRVQEDTTSSSHSLLQVSHYAALLMERHLLAYLLSSPGTAT